MENNVPQEKEEKEAQPKAEAPMEKKEEEQKTLVDEAREEREAIKKERELLTAENDRTEKLKAIETLGGRADAGEVPPADKKDTPEEFVKKLDSGELHTKDFLDTSSSK